MTYNQLTTEEFIKKAREIHGDKYDYSKVEYVNASTKVCIICPEHGEFFIKASHFLSGHGCVKCVRPNSGLTTEEFICKAKEVHGDKYDYSKVEYVNATTKICIICPEHGEFWQTPMKHLKGQGCPKCARIKQADSKRMKCDEFIRRAKEVHSDKYDYSKVEYVNATTKICIICPEHGEFWQRPLDHIKNKSGCPYCVGKGGGINGMCTTKEFIKKAKEVHGNKYDYSKVEYKGVFTKLCIICPIHGEFWQTPQNHLNGGGCKKCVNPNYGLTTEEFINKAREVHGNKYDYSKVEYVNINTKVCIICPIHGEFWQTPQNHLNGAGCIKCNGREVFNREDFVEKAHNIHGDKYDYSKVEYVKSSQKVCIICPEHGEFWQKPNNHLNGQGCPFCNHGLTKQYKFNLLQEFESEYEFKAFLENNDINILMVILRNIEPKYEPLKKDIEKALDRSFVENPIKALEEKYSSESEDELDDEEWAESESPTEVTTMAEIDLDDDDAVEAMLSNDKQESVKEEEHSEPTIEDVIKNTEQEIKVINKIEHLLTPEDRKYIMDKFLNDKRRVWMLNREKSVK